MRQRLCLIFSTRCGKAWIFLLLELIDGCMFFLINMTAINHASTVTLLSVFVVSNVNDVTR